MVPEKVVDLVSQALDVSVDMVLHEQVFVQTVWLTVVCCHHTVNVETS